MHDEQSLDRRNHPITEEEMAFLEKYPDLKDALENLQGNILRGHGRDYSVHLLLRFRADKKEEVKDQLRSLARNGQITSALQQRRQSDTKNTEPDTLFCSFVLSAVGYKYLAPTLIKEFPEEFQGGMRGARRRLNDPPDNTWEADYQHKFHAMVLLACSNPNTLRGEVQAMRARFKWGTEYTKEPSVTEVFKAEWGKVKRRGKQFVEHFGYVEGISQPLFFQKDVEREMPNYGEVRWDPSAGPRLVLIRDPGDKETRNAFGSYLVFRKLEQDMPRFQCIIKDMVTSQSITEDEAKARIIGRFPNGKPIVPSYAKGTPDNINNFAFFSVDPEGAICPFSAHIRKVNPRDDISKAREHRIARRGITYEEGGSVEPQDNASTYDPSSPPVGMLFMGYQSDFKNQFEFIQSLWANNTDFLREGVGVDPIIGQGDHQRQQRASERPSLVTLKGGEYFFAPSISFLKKL